MREYVKLPTISNQAAGNTVTITLPVGNTYSRVHLDRKAGGTEVPVGEITNVKIEINGKIVSEWPTLGRMESMQRHFGHTAKEGVTTFEFRRGELKTEEERRYFGLDTNGSQGITTAVIKFDLGAGFPEGGRLEAFAEKLQSVAGAPNWLTKVRRFIVPVTAAGTIEIDNIPRPAGAHIAAIHLYKSDITKAQLLIDNTSWYEFSKALGVAVQKDFGRVPDDASATVVDMLLDGDMKQTLPLTPGIQDMRLRCDVASAGQIDVMVEYLDLYGAGRF